MHGVVALVSPYLLQGILSQLSMVQLSVAGEILFAVPVILYLVIKRIRPDTWIPFRKIGISTLLMSVLTGILLLPLVTFINAFSMLFATNYVSEEQRTACQQSFLGESADHCCDTCGDGRVDLPGYFLSCLSGKGRDPGSCCQCHCVWRHAPESKPVFLCGCSGCGFLYSGGDHWKHLCFPWLPILRSTAGTYCCWRFRNHWQT